MKSACPLFEGTRDWISEKVEKVEKVRAPLKQMTKLSIQSSMNRVNLQLLKYSFRHARPFPNGEELSASKAKGNFKNAYG